MLMNLRLQLRIMMLTLRASGTRTLFAVGAVALGIAATTIMLALESGARRELESIAERMGKNLFSISAGRVASAPGRGGGWSVSTRLGRSDVVAMKQRIEGISSIVPILEGSRRTTFDGREHLTNIRGVAAGFTDVRNFSLADGRLLDDDDERNRGRVAVVGPFIAQRINEGDSLVGETILIDGIPFDVVGQLAEKGISDNQNEDDQILVPLETARRRLFNVEWFSRVLVQVEREDLMAAVQKATRAVLRESHELDGDARDDFEILSLIRLSEMSRVSSEVLRGLAQLFVLITLVVGGAGVLAVTWLNAKDRTAEIGLRMAIGARRRDVAKLFVAEASVLSIAGGLSGVLLGALAVAILKPVTGWQLAIDLRGVALPLLVSFGLGLASGLGPALRAASVPPVEALRDR